MSDDSDTFSKMLTGLTAGTHEVDLDLPPPQSSPNSWLAGEFARVRMEAIANGQRVGYMYLVEDREHSRWRLAGGVTVEQCRDLIAAGARWIGAKYYEPPAR